MCSLLRAAGAGNDESSDHNVECGHQDDDGEDDRQHILLELEGAEQRSVHLSPRNDIERFWWSHAVRDACTKALHDLR